MKLLEARANLLKAEMRRGNGAGPSYPFPVGLEPPFEPFRHAVPRQKSRCPFRPARQTGARDPERAATFAISLAEIRPSTEDDFKSPRAEELPLALHPSHPLAFEVVGRPGEVKLQLAGAEEDIRAAVRQVSAHYPSAEVFLSNDRVRDLGPLMREARSYQLKESYLFALRSGHPVDPYTTLLGDLDGLGEGECAVFQVLFIPIRHDWQGNILGLSRDPWDPVRSPFYDLPRLPRSAEDKVSSGLFAVAVRLAASSRGLLDRLEGSFLTLFTSEESRLVRRDSPCPVQCIVARTSLHHGMVLNARELAALVHVPDPDFMPESLEVAEHGAPPPSAAVNNILLPLGRNRYRGRETPVGISAEQAPRHVAFFGRTGVGKTTGVVGLLEPFLDQGGGLAAIDHKADFADLLLDRIPAHRIADVVLFDPTDPTHSPALNPLKKTPELTAEAVAGALMVGINRLCSGSSEFGPWMQWYSRAALRTLLAADGERTLLDLKRFLDEAPFRESVLATVKDRELRDFWRIRKLRQNTVDALLSRLSSFLDRPTIRDVVCQPGLIDFRQIKRENKIFIARLEQGVLQDATYVLSSFIFSMWQLTCLSTRPHERALFPVVVDEFQHIAGQDADVEGIEIFLGEARSYLTPLFIATQHLGRLNRNVISAFFGNLGNLVVMQMGPIDAAFIQRELGSFTEQDILDLRTGEAIVRIGSARDAFNTTFQVPEPRPSHRQAIIAHSRQSYYRPKSEIHAMLERSLEPEPQRGPTPPEDVPAQSGPPAPPKLTPDQWRMLEYLADHPDETVTAVYKGLGFSGGRGSKVRQQLREKGMVVEVETRLGQGNRPAVFTVPTIAGLRAVNKPLRSGRGGGVHRHFQDVVARQGRALGYQANTEYRLEEGGSVDVHLSRGGVQVAVEIAIQSRPQRECQNIRKCLRAGYDRVLALFLDPQLLQDTRSSFSRDANEQDRQRVSFLEPERLAEELR